MSKHTPGPWFVMNTTDVFTGLSAKAADGRKTASDDGWHIADFAPGGSFVEGSTGLHELSLDEIKANARLGAAAPDLLAMLIEAHEIIDSWGHEETAEVTARMRALIERAGGDWR